MPKQVARKINDRVIFKPSKNDSAFDSSQEYAAIVTGTHEKDSGVDLSVFRPGSSGSVAKLKVPHSNFVGKDAASWKNA